MSADTANPDSAPGASASLRDSSAALLAQAGELRDSSAVLLARARDWGAAPRPQDPLVPGGVVSRLVALDAARVLATFGVMWTHVAEIQGQPPSWAALGRFGTSFYILAAVYFSTRSALKRPDEPFISGLEKRARRLLVPFLLWSFIYATYYASVALPRGDEISELTLWWGPFAGTARHLWFLPFAFMAGTVAGLLAPRLMTVRTTRLVGIALGLTGFIYWFSYRVAFFALDRYWAIRYRLHRMDRWIEEIPLMVLAIFATALYVRLASRNEPRHLAMGELRPSGPAPASGSERRPSSPPSTQLRSSPRVGITLLGAFVVLELLYLVGHETLMDLSKTEGRFVANMAGISLLGGFLAFGRQHWMEVMAPLGRLTYFAFLAHVLLIDIFNVYLAGLPGYGSLVFSLLSTLVLFAASVSLGALARRFQALRWLIP